LNKWTFVTNHAVVLSYAARHPRITAREMAHEIGITERAVRKIIKDLVDAGYLSKTREGRGVSYCVRRNLSMRHRTQKEKMVGDLLKLLGKKRSSHA
jgi:predicted transcriptional regulator